MLALLVKWGNGQMDAGSGHGSATKGQLYDLEGAGSGALAAMYPFPSHPIPRVGSHFVLLGLFCKH